MAPAQSTNGCPNFEKNLSECGCTYSACPRRGKCCECVSHHRAMNQLPGCFFPPDVEKTYDRSYTRFAQVYN